jgi:hypothetical protein
MGIEKRNAMRASIAGDGLTETVPCVILKLNHSCWVKQEKEKEK